MNRTSRNRIPGIAALVLALAACAAAGAADWPQLRGPDRDGVSPEKDVWTEWPPKTLWTFEAGVGYASVSIADGRVYASGNFARENTRGVDVIQWLELETGKPIWTHK